jgi:lipopolysaccharide export system protein LptC
VSSSSTLAPLPTAPKRQRQPLAWRLHRWASNYLPLLVLGLMALATTWLVRQSPLPDGPTEDLPPRTKPDYEMRGFELQRFAKDAAGHGWLRGDVLRHFPDGDRLEIEGLRLRLQGQDGSWLLLESDHAQGPQDGSRLVLRGNVKVRRFAPNTQPDVDPPMLTLTTAELLALDEGRELSSGVATQVLTSSSRLQLSNFRYRHDDGSLRFTGPSKAELNPRKRP